MNDISVETHPQESTDVIWPHLQDGEVSYADYAAHYAANQDKYHELLRPIVEGVLSRNELPKEQETEEAQKRAQLIDEEIDRIAGGFMDEEEQYSPDEMIDSLLHTTGLGVSKPKPSELLNGVIRMYGLNSEEAELLKPKAYVSIYRENLVGLQGITLLDELKEDIPLTINQKQVVVDGTTELIERPDLHVNWDNASPTTVYTQVQQFVAEYGLEPKILDRWRAHAAPSFIASQYDASTVVTLSRGIQRELSAIGVPEPEQEHLEITEYMNLIRSSRGIMAKMLYEDLLQNAVIDPNHIKEAGQVGLVAWSDYAANSIDDLRTIWKLCDEPADYVQQPKVYKMIALGLGNKIYGHDDLQEVNSLLTEVHLPHDANDLIDTRAAAYFDKLGPSLVNFLIPSETGNSVEQFPKLYAKAFNMLGDELDSDEDVADYFVEKLGSFASNQSWLEAYALKAVSHYSVANKFLNALSAEAAWSDQAWVLKVTKAAEKTVGNEENSDEWWSEDNTESGSSIEVDDPYENHKWQFGPEQAKVASALSKLIAGKLTETALKNLGIAAGMESANGLSWTLQNMATAIDNTIQTIERHLKAEDMNKELGVHSESGLSQLKVVVRGLASRYIAQSIDNDQPIVEEIQRLSLGLNEVLREGCRAYQQVLEVDVPLYDKLYEEFDELRADGRKPMEVYLGRDGIYAWIGRRAQDASRRRKAVAEGWSRSEILEIHPKYVVYPRYFRDSMSLEAQKKYLEQATISQDGDPIFYDTGYTGTIPEQMMQVMGFSQDEIEQRIKLLSANQGNRRVRGISENARTDIIEKIEYNAKLHNSAEGMVRDMASGEIRPIAKPTSPREQFKFLMIQQAISRHYWYKERHDGKPANIQAPVELATA